MGAQRSPMRKAENLKKAVEPLVREFGTIPSAGVVGKRRLWEINNAIIHFQGGYQAFRKKLGLPEWNSKKPFAKLRDWEEYRKIAEPAAEKLGGLPGEYEAYKRHGLLPVYNAANEFHGGLPAVRKRLGVYKPLVVKNPKLAEQVTFAKEVAGDAERFQKLLSTLNAQHEALIRARLGVKFTGRRAAAESPKIDKLIEKHGHVSLQKIGGVFGFSRERASQVNKMAFEALKAAAEGAYRARKPTR